MANEVIKQNGELLTFTPDKVKLIKQLIAPKANDAELQLFLHQCQRTGLDPLTRQIYCIHRWSKDGDKMTIQTSIDGFRVVAERSGTYAGQGEPEYSYKGEKLDCCKIRVYRFNGNNRYEAAVGVAYWAEYVQLGKDGKPMGLWAKMPHVMLAKVAEAVALRKAFPQDLSGLYTGDEMEQSDTVQDVPHEVVNTTLYNHKELGSKEKPLTSNAQFTKLLERVKGGDTEAYAKAAEAFTLEPKQKEVLELHIADLIDKN